MVNNGRIFYRGLTYDEWASQQDTSNLEFRAISTYHKTHPGYDLEEIRNSIFLNVIETEENQKICIESFSARHVNSQKLNDQMDKLCRIIFSASSEYNSIDKRGHGDMITTKFGGRNKDAESVSFRIEEKAIRQAHYLIDHNLVSEPTVTDLVRKGFVKYIEMLPITNEIRDGVTNRFLLDIKIERENLERIKVTEMLKGHEARLIAEEEDLMQALRSVDNHEVLEEIRDWTVDFVQDVLSYNGPTKKEVSRIKEFVMGSPRLYNILTTLERHSLVTKEYIDNVRMKGVVTPAFDAFSGNDTKP